MNSFELFTNNCRTMQAGERRVQDTHRMIGELMLRMGIGPHLVGFAPLCEGVRITAERDRAYGADPPQNVIPTVETLCDIAAGEHAMRDAIGVGFLNPDGIHAEIFPFTDRPSNYEFICTLAELVRDRIAPQRKRS